MLTENLRSFYDFTDKVVLFVGAGARLLDAFVRAKKLIAIDKDVAALKELETSIAVKGFQGSVEIVGSTFEEVTRRGDVAYFEFCLHEMIKPLEALNHARSLAGEILVYDHLPASEWVFYAAEEDLVCRSTEAMDRFGVRRRQTFCTEQRFQNYSELLAKISGQGPTAIQRVQRFDGHAAIAIPMTCQLALL
jgi:tRNA G37 N-methylase Trm5